MNVIEMNERDPYEMDTEEQPEDPEFKWNWKFLLGARGDGAKLQCVFESVYEECGFLELIAGTDVKVWRKLFLKNGDSECRDMKSHAV